MSENKPDLYAGLDQMIAKPTKPAEPEPEAQPAPTTTREADHAVSESRGNQETNKKSDGTSGTRLVREVEPDLPDVLYLYRKQTLEFGPKDLEAVEHIQQVMSEAHTRQITKTEIVRAAVEFLVKDFNAHREQSFIVRKFVRRR